MSRLPRLVLPRVEELARTPEYLGVHEVSSAGSKTVPGSRVVLGVELHLGSKNAVLRMNLAGEDGGEQGVVTMLEAPGGKERSLLPHCFQAHWVGPYRVRPLSFSVETVEESVVGPNGVAFTISTDVVRAVVAVGHPKFDPVRASLRSPALEVGNGRRLWLTSTSAHCQRHTLVGAAGDHFDLALHIAPVVVQGRGDEGDASFLFAAEIVLMRTGDDIESHDAIKVQETAKGQSLLVADHRVTVKKLHAPLSQKDTSGPEELIRSDYPILILHVQVKVERISLEEAERMQWEKLLSD